MSVGEETAKVKGNKERNVGMQALWGAESRVAGVRVEEDVFLLAILYLLILEHCYFKKYSV